MNVVRKENTYTIDDIFALPEGKHAELLDGQIYDMAPPSRKHQDILFSLSRKITDYIDSTGGKCKVYLAPFAVFLNADDHNMLSLIFLLSVTNLSLMTKAAMARLTGSLKLFRLAAGRWIITRNCLNTGQQVSENIG